ncbi:MAG: hypothetical protein ABIS50_01615 [Luteolibacter sp.]|uniref:hypothetical protein n=1 Tax=Luteolibacter sp. TaxID=1962973 RepID=UPI00326764F9
MSRGERGALRRNLFAEWGNRDPQGLLAFLDKKSVWPEDFSFYSSLGTLENDRPDLLLDFAIRNGCVEALSPLKYGDPATVARLIDALPASQRGVELTELRDVAYQDMGKQGIVTATPNAANLGGSAESMLDDGRLEEFIDTFGKIDDESVRSKLARDLGFSLSYEKLGERVFETICKLPLSFQIEATSELFRNAGSAMVFPEAREERRHWIDQFAAQGLAEGAASGIDGLFVEDDLDRVNGEIAAWVSGWESGDSLKPMADRLVLEWSGFDHEVMIRELVAMPEGKVRDQLAAAALRNGDIREDEEISKVKSLILDPAILKEMEPDPNADPFADPFADPEEK